MLRQLESDWQHWPAEPTIAPITIAFRGPQPDSPLVVLSRRCEVVGERSPEPSLSSSRVSDDDPEVVMLLKASKLPPLPTSGASVSEELALPGESKEKKDKPNARLTMAPARFKFFIIFEGWGLGSVGISANHHLAQKGKMCTSQISGGIEAKTTSPFVVEVVELSLVMGTREAPWRTTLATSWNSFG